MHRRSVGGSLVAGWLRMTAWAHAVVANALVCGLRRNDGKQNAGYPGAVPSGRTDSTLPGASCRRERRRAGEGRCGCTRLVPFWDSLSTPLRALFPEPPPSPTPGSGPWQALPPQVGRENSEGCAVAIPRRRTSCGPAATSVVWLRVTRGPRAIGRPRETESILAPLRLG